MRVLAGLSAIASLVLFAGCASPPPRGGHFADARDLAGALSDAGVGCDALRGSAGAVSRGLDEAACAVGDATVVIHVYACPEDRPGVREKKRGGGVSWVVGENWNVIATSGAAAAAIRDAIGGRILEPSSGRLKPASAYDPAEKPSC